MCGILLMSGPKAHDRVANGLKRLRHRGPDDTDVWYEGTLALGFSRLAINGDRDTGRQPYRSNGWVAAFNGEIYNHDVLTRRFDLPATECDTRVILPLFHRLGTEVLANLDGFYAGVIVDPALQRVYCFRDWMGKKPLFVGTSGSEHFIVSELKAIEGLSEFTALPKGLSVFDLNTGELTLLAEHSVKPTTLPIETLLNNSVRKRLPKADQPLGVFLSGGLDSAIIACLVMRHRPNATFFCLGEADSPDVVAVRLVAQALQIQDLRFIGLPRSEELDGLLNSVVYFTESFNPSIVSNGLATYLLAQAAHKAGIKVVLTGEGADEFFGGYHQFSRVAPWQSTRQQLIDDMEYTELRRLDLSCMAHSVEPRCPFLDPAVCFAAQTLSYEQLYSKTNNKIALREAFDQHLPAQIIGRRKVSCDVGSGIRGLVVRHLRCKGQSERLALKRIWIQCFQRDAEPAYFHRYPVFDAAIEQRGEQHR